MLTYSHLFRGESCQGFFMQGTVEAFKEVMRAGDVTIQVPADSPDVYHLKYTGKSCTFARNTERTFAKIGLAFVEPNPRNRT